MRILIVGNDPHEVGGVANYTRPLAQKFVELGNDVNYFYSGAFSLEYDWRLKPFLKINRTDFSFEYAGLVNSPCWTTNFGNPNIDISEPRTEALFSAYLDRVKPDVVHIHSRLGLPVGIVKCAAQRGIPIISTIHVYGFLCQKRVMIDHLGGVCGGPSDFVKCSLCTGRLNIVKKKFNVRVANTSSILFSCMVDVKNRLKAALGDTSSEHLQTLSSVAVDSALAEGLARRLECMTGLMNSAICRNICVSEDVKNTMLRFGVRADRLIVQHIGSLIAETQRSRSSQLNNPIVIGNIGGVSYYKGTHVLVNAIRKMKSRNIRVKIFGKYENAYQAGVMRGLENLPVEFTGRYAPAQLPEILDKIDIMVLPSICNDTAPQTIFESYSRSVPIIASNIGGFPDFIEDNVNGRLFSPGDADQLADILDDIVSDPNQIGAFSEHIPKLKTMQENAEELLSLYETTRCA